MEIHSHAQPIQFTLNGYLAKFNKSGGPRNEREEMLDKFLARLNPARKSAGIPPLTIGRLVRIFEGVPTSDLHPFYVECDRARNFSSLFWYKVRGPKEA